MIIKTFNNVLFLNLFITVNFEFSNAKKTIRKMNYETPESV